MKPMTGAITVFIALFALTLVGPPEARAATRAEIKRMVVEEALNSRVPPSLALAVAKVESDFQAKALSHAGARGVMQIMPATARGVFGVDADELWDPRLNIQLGIDYLEQLYDQYGQKWDLALSHYNGGTLRGKGARATPHSYTRKYVASVLNWHRRYDDQAHVWRFAKDDTKDEWRRARTRVAVRPWVAPRKVVVRELPAAAVVRWYPADEDAVSAKHRDSDAFTEPRRHFPTRGRLDDFSPRVTWRDS